jgi:hypothetical protein
MLLYIYIYISILSLFFFNLTINFKKVFLGSKENFVIFFKAWKEVFVESRKIWMVFEIS